MEISAQLNEYSNTTTFSDGHIKLSTALMIDAVRAFSNTVYNSGNIETAVIDCNSNDDFKHGYSLVNKIRPVLQLNKSKVFELKYYLLRVFIMV